MSTSTVVPAAPSHDATMVVAFELSKAKWKVGIVLPQSTKLSRYTIAGGDTGALAELLAKSRQKAERRCGVPVRVVSCYEAGYDGFWLHRWLAGHDVINHVLDPASIEVNRRARRAKTDRIDLEKLMRALLAHRRGEPKACSVVRVPSVEEEDAKRHTRELERLRRERGAHINRIKALLHGQGIRDVKPTASRFPRLLPMLRTGDGRQVPPQLAAEIAREHARLCLIDEQLKTLARKTVETVQTAPPASAAAKARLLMTLRGIDKSALVLANEVFYRRFANRREVGGYFGLAGTPYDSGETQREQGISKAGNHRARALAIELAWLWLRHQRESALSQWFLQRVGSQKGRVRKIAIVALARKLMVALWRFVEFGLVPHGALVAAAVRG